MKYDRWDVAGYDRAEAARLFRSGINPLISVVLAARHVLTGPEIHALLENKPATDTDPRALQDMDAAVRRIQRAIDAGEHVAVYGDYDVDGITSTSLLSDYLESKGLACETYIPNRLEEGYGIRRAGLDALHELGVTLIITVDCGITAVEEAQYARMLGMDLVITDHHECGTALPEAAAVVDPKRKENPASEAVLAGVGVAFRLLCALEGPGQEARLLREYGDLVALGTIADVMPVLGDNRTLIRRGLETARRGDRPGIRHLCQAAGVEAEKLSVMGVSFALAPRLNAAGRLGNADIALALLKTRDESRAAELAEEMCRLNRRRQQLEQEMLSQSLSLLETEPPNGKPIVLAGEDWHQGVGGIVASRLCEKFSLPVIMICLQDGVGRGSCRSVEGFGLHAALSRCSDLLIAFGGHEMAAGLTVAKEQIPALRERMGKLFLESPAAGMGTALKVDAELPKAEILTVENVDALAALDPYGNGNPVPLFCITGGEIRSVAAMGNGKHTRLTLQKNGVNLECVFFSHSPPELGAETGRSADIVFSPQINEFRGRRSVQLLLSDIRVS